MDRKKLINQGSPSWIVKFNKESSILSLPLLERHFEIEPANLNQQIDYCRIQ